MNGGGWAASIVSADSSESFLGAPYRKTPVAEWASVTKMVTAATMIDFCGSESIPLDSQVRDLAASFSPLGSYTIRDLIAHTSGLPRVHHGMPAGVRSDPYEGASMDVVRHALSSESARPGPRVYSNLGYAALGILLEDLAKAPWFEVAWRLVLAPAGAETATIEPHRSERAVARTMFGRVLEPWAISRGPYGSAGGLWGSVGDMAKVGWFLRDHSSISLAWERANGMAWISGQLRNAGSCIVLAKDVVISTHVLSGLPGAADRRAMRLLGKR